MSRISGIPVGTMAEAVECSLPLYTEESGLAFDLKEGVQLALTPDKPNSARCVIPAHYRGKRIGDLFAIVFAPGDGTGDETHLDLKKLNTDRYPHHPKVVARLKKPGVIGAEVGITIATFGADQPNTDPKLFAGNLDLLSVKSQIQPTNDRSTKIVIKIGELGQPADQFQRILGHLEYAAPTATLTVGQRGDIRFGGEHAVYAPHPELVQIFGFLALSDDVLAANPGLLSDLNVRWPGDYPYAS
jgi:hypothetical protein